MKQYQVYFVPTPIGNIQDITIRALEVFKTVDIIACEDSRITQKILNKYDIKTKLISYHKYNEKSRIELILSYVNNGKTVALVSDAGTPMICDPGTILLNELIKNDIKYTSLPGACAVSTFLSAIPRDDEIFTFIGFLPRIKQDITKIVQQYSNSNIVFYDSPNRILKSLEIIKEIRGNIKIALAREISKLYEEYNISDIDSILFKYNEDIKGEIVCMLYKSENNNYHDFHDKIIKLKTLGYKSKEIAKIISLFNSVSKNDIYQYILDNFA